MSYRILFLFFCLALYDCSNQGAGSTTFKSCGIDDIDHIRREIPQYPTTTENAADRRAALYRWWKFLWRQGYDLSSFNNTAQELLDTYDDSAKGRKIITRAYSEMEKIFADPEFVPEISGTPSESWSKTNWPVYHGTNGHQTGYSPDSGPSEGKISWQYPKGYIWTARPVIENGKVYLASPGIDVIGYCLDELSGKVLWNARQYGTDFYQTSGSREDPVLSSGRIIFRTRKSDLVFNKETGERIIPSKSDYIDTTNREFMVWKHHDSSVMLGDAKTGEGIWQFRSGGSLAGEPVQESGSIYAARKDGRVFCLHSNNDIPQWEVSTTKEIRGTPGIGMNNIYLGTSGGQLLAINKKDGKINWTYQAHEKEPHAYQFFSTASESNGRVYAGSASGQLYCLDAEKGRLLWKYQASDWIRSKPVAIGENIYILTLDSRMFALRDAGNTAEELWDIKLGEHGFMADLVGNQNTLLASGRDLILYAVDPATGDLLWKHGIVDGAWVDGRFHAGDWIGGLQSSPTVVDGIVYAGGPDGFLDAVDSETGERIWRFETGGNISLAPTVAEGKVFFGCLGDPGLYYALDKDSGDLVWVSPYIRGAWCGAAYARNRIFAGCMDGKMRAASASTGEILWVYDAGFSLPTSGELFGIYSNTISDERNVYFGSWAGYYEALDQLSGKLLWRTKTCYDFTRDRKPDSSAPVLWKDHIYVQKLVSRVAAINKYSGNIDWEWEVPEGRFQNGTVAAFNNKIFASASLGREIIPYESSIYALSDVENGGELLWEARGGGGLTAPVGTDDKLITGSSADVFMTCFNPEDGSVIWRCYTGGVMGESVPAIYGNKVYAQFRNGWLLAIQ